MTNALARKSASRRFPINPVAPIPQIVYALVRTGRTCAAGPAIALGTLSFMSELISPEGGPLRRLIGFYGKLLDHLLVFSVAILVVPVSLQIFSRFTSLIPHYIWTEEMARFIFIWTVMIGAMVGVRDSAHFEVDLLPKLGPRGEAMARLLGRLGVLALALVFVWAGIQFTKFAWNRISELAELPLWLIHVAWPVTGLTWLLFLGPQVSADLKQSLGGRA
jgi:TRAP-type C4-dicarboxylate transport system permease small subunit